MQARNRILWGLAGAAALAAAWWGLRPQPLPVALGEVDRGEFILSIEEDGKTQVRDRYTVHAPSPGKMQRSRWKVGDHVKQGDALALLDPPASPMLDTRTLRESEARIAAALAALDQAKAAAAAADVARRQARRDQERMEILVAKRAVTRQALEMAQEAAQSTARNSEAAQAARHAAEHELDLARAALSPAQGKGAPGQGLSAPVSGEILKVYRESGGEVLTGEPLFDIASIGALEVVVNVLSPDAVRIRPGMDVQLDRWGGDHALAGRVRRVEPAAATKVSALGVEEQRVDVRVDLTSPPESWQRLGDGYRVEARIVLERIPDALKAPVAALFRDGDAWAVYVARGGRVRKRPVTIGAQNGNEFLVLGGLEAGEKVVLHPGDEIREGVSVKGS